MRTLYNAILVCIFIILVCSNAYSTGRFVNGEWVDDATFTQSLTFSSAVTVNPSSSTGELIKSTCTSGALNSCSCYTTTSSNKIGAVKVNINGVDRWLRLYDNPN